MTPSRATPEPRPPTDRAGAVDAAAAARAAGEGNTGLRNVLEDTKASPIKKYQDLVVGKRGLLGLLIYEIVFGWVAGLPGAFGLALRGMLYKRFLGACGGGVVFGKNVTIRHPHRIRLGKGVILDDGAVLDGKGDAETTIDLGDEVLIGRNSILSCKGGTFRMGERTNIGPRCTLISETEFVTGDRVLVAGNCYLIAGGNHGIARLDIPAIDQPMLSKGGLRIDENCWLGAGCMVLDGTRLGRDCVVSAGSMVDRAFGPFKIISGSPAKEIADRRQLAGHAEGAF